MRTLGVVLTIGSIVMLIISGIVGVIGHYQYSKQYDSYWELSVKASSIEKKIEGIDKFVQALEKSDLNGKYNALFLETPNNSFDENFAALKSLQIRLHDISKMDIKSFEYQTALQQITGQEQNEAAGMLSVFSGIWWKDNHFFLWDWICITQICVFIGLVLIGAFFWTEY